jgi:methylated-DNA-protein-cysteine methyltransferase related protein
MNVFNKVYRTVKKVPKGKITTYGAIAQHVGSNPRMVGYALHANQDQKLIPCHRVINSKGMISSGFAFGGPDKQKKMLSKEGIRFNKNGVVDLNRFGFFLF